MIVVASLTYLGFGLGFFVLAVVLLILIAVFEVWMFVSAITNKYISDTAKILWVIGMLVIHPFVAIVYFFTDYKRRSGPPLPPT